MSWTGPIRVEWCKEFTVGGGKKKKSNLGAGGSGQGAIAGSDVLNCDIRTTVGAWAIGRPRARSGRVEQRDGQLVLVSRAGTPIAVIEDSPLTEPLRVCIGRGHVYSGHLHSDLSAVDVEPAA
jgi:hypothetical protein